MSADEGGFQIRVEPRDGYVYVWQRNTFTTVEELGELHAAIERALAESACRCVLFDNREATQAEMDVRAHMWTWLTTTPQLKRAAIVAHSTRVTRRATRTADINRVVLRAFHEEGDAVTWLVKA